MSLFFGRTPERGSKQDLLTLDRFLSVPISCKISRVEFFFCKVSVTVKTLWPVLTMALRRRGERFIDVGHMYTMYYLKSGMRSAASIFVGGTAAIEITIFSGSRSAEATLKSTASTSLSEI